MVKLATSLFRMLRAFVILATLMVLYMFLRIHHPNALIFELPILNDFFDNFHVAKGLHYVTWVILLFLASVLIRSLSNIIKNLLKPY